MKPSPFKILSPSQYISSLSRADQNNRSCVSPDKTWSEGNPKILSDSDVDEWLSRNSPSTLRDINSEAGSISRQRRYEAPGHSDPEVASAMSETVSSDSSIYNQSNFFTRKTRVEQHWTNQLFPDLGRKDICEIVKPCVSDSVFASFYLNFYEYYTAQQIACIRNLNVATITDHLSRVRSDVVRKYLAVSKSPIATVAEEEIDFVALMEQRDSAITTTHISDYRNHDRRRKVHACSKCSRHLGSWCLDHDKKEPGKERYLRCDTCGSTFPESVWPTLLA